MRCKGLCEGGGGRERTRLWRGAPRAWHKGRDGRRAEAEPARAWLVAAARQQARQQARGRQVSHQRITVPWTGAPPPFLVAMARQQFASNDRLRLRLSCKRPRLRLQLRLPAAGWRGWRDCHTFDSNSCSSSNLRPC